MLDLRPLKDLRKLLKLPCAPCARAGDLGGTDGMLPPPLAAAESVSDACKPCTDIRISFGTKKNKRKLYQRASLHHNAILLQYNPVPTSLQFS